MKLIDTHAHVYDQKLMEDYGGWSARAKAAGVSTVLLPNIDLASIGPLKQLLTQDANMFKGMMGLHPCDVKEDWENTLEIIRRELFDHPELYCGVGEIGLDYHWDLHYVEAQKTCFRMQMDWAVALNKPIAIHMRKSLDEGIQLVKEYKKAGIRGVFHCFSGSLEQAKQIMHLGMYMGIGGVLTYKNAGVAEVVKDIPMEYLVLETDAPYLTPVPHRGKLNEPAYMALVAKKLAELKNISVEEVAAITSENAERLFSL